MEYGAAEHDSQPLRGRVLCSTAIDQDKRAEIVKSCEEMGGKYTLDLTSDVTHMIVGAVDTAKYAHIAKSRADVKVLGIEWIFALREAWTNAEEIDLARLEEQHRLPTFFGLSICVTGFSDLEERQNLVDAITACGGKYYGALSKTISHLIVADTKSEKYIKACAWNVKTVALEWLEQSIQRGMVLDEKCFAPTLPPNQIGVGALVPLQPKPKRPRTSSEANAKPEGNKRKMRRTASSKLNSQNQTIWADIKTVELQDEPNAPSAWHEGDPRRTETESRPLMAPSVPEHASSERPGGLFSGWICCIHGFSAEKDAKVRQVLIENDARIAKDLVDMASIADADSLAHTVLIVPAAWNAKPNTQLPRVDQGTRYATEWWIERCIYQRHAFDPADDIYSQTLVNLSSSCFDGLRVSSSGLDQDLLYFAKLVKAAGGSYLEQFVNTSTLLVCNESQCSSEKVAYAIKHKIEIVTRAWFLECLRSGQRQPLHSFRMPKHFLKEVEETMRSRLGGANDEVTVEKNNEKGQREESRNAAKRLSGMQQRRSKSALVLAQTTQPQQHPPIEPIHTEAAKLNGPKHDTIFEEEPQSQDGAAPLDSLSPNVGGERSGRPRSDSEIDSVRVSTVIEVPTAEKENQRDHLGEQSVKPTEKEYRGGLSDAVSELLTRQQSRGSASANDAHARSRRRRDQKLGRAPSGAGSASFNNLPRLEVADSEETAAGLSMFGGADHGPVVERPSQVPQASQQLLYEAPGAQELRKLVSKRLGSDFIDEEGIGTRVERLGVVRDADAKVAAGVGQRVRGRARG